MKIFLILNNNSINILKRLYSNYNKNIILMQVIIILNYYNNNSRKRIINY